MSYQAGQPSYLLAKVGGFFLVPVVGALATRLAAPLVDAGASAVLKDPKKQPHPDDVAGVVGAFLHAGVAYAAYRVSEGNSPVGTQAFARGGMWGSVISSAFCATSTVALEKTPMPATAGVKLPLADHALGLLSARAAGAVAAKRVASFARLPR